GRDRPLFLSHSGRRPSRREPFSLKGSSGEPALTGMVRNRTLPLTRQNTHQGEWVYRFTPLCSIVSVCPGGEHGVFRRFLRSSSPRLRTPAPGPSRRATLRERRGGDDLQELAQLSLSDSVRRALIWNRTSLPQRTRELRGRRSNDSVKEVCPRFTFTDLPELADDKTCNGPGATL